MALPEDMETTAKYDISLISGKMRSLGKEQNENDNNDYGDNFALVKKPDGTMALAPARGAGTYSVVVFQIFTIYIKADLVSYLLLLII